VSATIWTNVETGPASYSTGGFTVTTTLANVDSASVKIKVRGANLAGCLIRPVRDSPSAGSLKVIIYRCLYDKLTALGDLSGLPSGVTTRTTSGGTYDAEAAHVHSMAHDHAAATTSTMAGAAGGIPHALNNIELSTHTHSADPPNFTGNTGAGSSHTHTWDSLYQHQHTPTQTATDMGLVEATAGTDFSDCTFYVLAADEA